MATLRLVEVPLQIVAVPDSTAAVETLVLTTIVPVAVTVEAEQPPVKVIV
jgi:hypothetical protein